MKTVGIIGGGQLGRMFIQNALNYGVEVHILDPDPDAPCAAIAHKFVVAERTDEEAVYAFGQGCDVITIEIENVSIEGLKRLRDEGKEVYPQPEVIELIKDKGRQKIFYRTHSLPTLPFALVEDENELRAHAKDIPFMQKLRVGGYDGKGVKPIKTEADLQEAMPGASVLEQWCDLDKELAVIVSRNAAGQMAAFPTVELVFDPVANLVDYLFSPADISPAVETRALELAKEVVSKLEMVGLLAIEFFLTKEGELLINEIAPRPHNSGHHTIEACLSSQFDQHLRAIMNWPLKGTELTSAAAMVNLLGESGHTGPVAYDGLEAVIDVEGVYPHFYGKAITKPARKMGHVTTVGPSVKDAMKKAKFVKENLKVISK